MEGGRSEERMKRVRPREIGRVNGERNFDFER